MVVGTGIRTVGHMTLESIVWIKQADKVLYVVGDPIAETMIKTLNPDGAESLSGMYAVGKPRIQTYNEMIDRILSCVRAGMLTCCACYGHPGVFVYLRHGRNTWRFTSGEFLDPAGWKVAEPPQDFSPELLQGYRAACLSASA